MYSKKGLMDVWESVNDGPNDVTGVKDLAKVAEKGRKLTEEKCGDGS